MRYLLWHGAAESARRYADRPAVADRGTVLSHLELERASNGLAALLAAGGGMRGERIGLFLPKSARSIAAMLAATKCGAIYVPVDPTAPAQRAAFILGNAGVRCLVTTRRLLDTLAEHMEGLSSLQMVLLADDESATVSDERPHRYGWGAIAPADAPPAVPGAVETDPAYILYTSGSTGTPKGVVISHRNALAFVDWAVETFGVGPDDRMSNHAPLHFDLSVFDIYAALHTGGCVVLVPDRLAPFPAELAKWIEEQRITVWYSVPSALIRLLKHGELDRFAFPALRVILFAGEVFPVRHLREVMPRFPHAEFYNLYGPTETNVCTYEPVPRPLESEGELPIGRACENFDVFALTADGRKAVAGEEGELVVRGPGVMLGYWKLPERTAKSLLPNPLHQDFADPIYRTGDLVRVLPDGESFAYVARLDHMVKTRGYRVELEEVEHVLHAYPRVRSAAVIAIPDEDVGARLRAAVVGEGDGELTEQELAKFCATRLPSYAIPEQFIMMPDLPRTSTGKVDRRALAESMQHNG